MSEMFSPFNPMKILTYSKEIQNLIDKDIIPYPAMVSFDFSNPCDSKCVWCSWERHRKEEGGYLDEKVFESIISDMVEMGVKGSEICGGGEALIHPQAHKFVSMLGEISDVLLITNGSHLVESDGMYSKTIRVSLDAATAETHKKLHGTDNFNKILDNIKKVSKLTRVGLGMLIHPENYHEIPLFAKLGKELGCEFVHIRPCYTDYDIIRDRVGFEWFTWIAENEDEVKELLSDAKSYETDDFKVYTTLYKTKPKKDWEFKKCYAPYLNPQITPTGGVWICCEQRGEPASLIGTIGVDGSFKDIWLSEKHLQLMKSRPNENCFAKCKFRGYNRVIWEAFIEDKYDLDWT